MSVQAITWAIEQDIRKPGAKLVLICAANYADRAGLCWPSQETLAKDASMGKRTVWGHLSWLEENGFIERTPRREGKERASDLIQLNLGNLNSPNRRVEEPSTRKKEGVELADSCNLNSQTSAKEPSLEPSENRQREGARARRATPLPLDWNYSGEDEAWALERWPAEVVEHETEKFVNHVRSNERERKDWSAEWRKWMLRVQVVDNKRPPKVLSAEEIDQHRCRLYRETGVWPTAWGEMPSDLAKPSRKEPKDAE